MIPKDHFTPDGSCSCPITGTCHECNKPCTDHDLVADYYWCSECLDRSWENYQEGKLKG